MTNLINSKPDQKIILNILKYYNGNEETLEEIAGEGMNFIYGFKQKNRDCILRICTHKSHKKDQVLAELNWIEYLSDCGISVSKPIYTVDGNKVLTIDYQGHKLVIVAFEKAHGRHIEFEDWTTDFIEQLGTITGNIHKYSKNYIEESTETKRFNWKNSLFIEILNKSIPKTEVKLWERINSVIMEIEKLSVDKNSYGMVHGDIHVGNFFIGDNITLFDFDTCEYNYFIYDIAVAIFYSVLFIDPDQGNESGRAKDFLIPFKKGYLKSNNLDETWFNKINLFLKLREYILYALLITYHDDLDNLPFFLKIFMENRKEKIEQDQPYIKL